MFKSREFSTDFEPEINRASTVEGLTRSGDRTTFNTINGPCYYV